MQVAATIGAAAATAPLTAAQISWRGGTVGGMICASLDARLPQFHPICLT
jgi:hypothetical protein